MTLTQSDARRGHFGRRGLTGRASNGYERMATSRLQWQSQDADAGRIDALCDALKCPRPVAAMLVGRGMDDPDDVRAFMSPRLSNLTDPFLVHDMDVAVERVIRALDGGERITVFGDYDVDGLTATALVVSVLGHLGADITSFTPCRRRDGYGLTEGAYRRCVAEHNPGLLITVDCGTNSQESIRLASETGLDVIVTDHHEVSDPVVPALAVLNPKLGAPPAARHLCGVGVAFKLCHAILKTLLADGREADTNELDLRDHLGLVALGTVCDIVPLRGENRAMVRYGLQRLEQTSKAGVAALREVAKVKPPLSCYHLGFFLGPRINAAGRLYSAEPALELLLTDDCARAAELAGDLDGANRERRQIEQSIVDDVAAELEKTFDPDATFGIVVGDPAWDVGVVGIVASRLCRRYGRPAVVIAFDEDGLGRGSCRSVESVDLVAALDACSSHLDTCGGHKAAAGLSLRQEALPAFRDAFNAYCSKELKGRDLRPVQVVDAWLDHLGEADARLLAYIDRLRPLGRGNPAPVWGVRHVTPVGPPRRVGRDGAHLKMTVAGGGSQIDTIGFGLGETVLPEGPLDLLFELEQNEFRGNVTLQLKLHDLRSSEPEFES